MSKQTRIKKNAGLADVFRQQIQSELDRGTSLRKISLDCGVNYPVLYRFMYPDPETGRTRDMYLATADKLMRHFGLQIVKADGK